MWIKRLYFDGFGVYCDRDITTSECGLTVFYGPNEVGKSTVTAFIRTMLFGFPRGSKAEGWYPPLSRGSHGGRVEIVDDDSNHYTLERHQVSRRDQFRIDGAAIRDHTLIDRLRGHLTQKAFEAIFAFNLSDLNGLGDDSDISSRIYSAGTGATQLPKALKELKRRQDEIYKQRGVNPKINRVLTELGRLDDDLQRAESQSKEYEAKRRHEDELVALIAETKQKKKEARIREAECRRLQGAWKTWLDSRKDDAELSRCSIQDGFPDEPLSRLKTLEDQLTQCEEARDRVKRDLSTATTKSNRAINNEALVLESDLSARCKTIAEKRQSYKDWVKDRPTQLVAQRKEQAEVTKCLQAVGSDWSPERLESLDLSQTTQDEVASWKEQLDELKEERLRLKTNLDRLDQERQKAERTVAHAQDGIAQNVVDDLDNKIALMDDVHKRCKEYTDAKKDFETGEDWANDAAPSADRRILAFGIGIVGAIATIVLWFQDFREWYYVPVGFTALLLLALLWSSLGTSQGGGNKIRDRKNKAREKVKETRRLFRDALTALDVIDLNDVDRVDRDTLDEKKRSFAGLQKARTDLRCAKDNTDDFRRRVVKQDGDIVNKTDAWSNWLKKRGFPDTLRVDTFSEFVRVVENARHALETLKTRQRRTYGITKDIEEYDDEVKAVATCDAISLDGEQSDVAELADQIISEMKAVETARTDRERHQQSANQFTNELQTAEEKLDRVKKQRDDLLHAGGAENAEAFRLKAKSHLKGQELTKARDVQREQLRAHFDLRRTYDELDQMFQNTEREAIDTEIESLKLQLDELDEEETAYRDELANLRVNIEGLSSDEQASEGRAAREELRQQARELAGQWSRCVIAESLLKEARTKYEEERQPAVVRRASKWFKQMSGNRYVDIHAEVGGDLQISVIDQAGRKKHRNS
jgi:uncharacterized protein YhaN